MAIADFYSGALSLDELSGIANEIYYPNIPIGDRDLDPALDYASELSYNIRQIDTKHRGAEGIGLGESIATIRQYYEQHKHANTT